jgi:hypothetical protein
METNGMVVIFGYAEHVLVPFSSTVKGRILNIDWNSTSVWTVFVFLSLTNDWVAAFVVE